MLSIRKFYITRGPAGDLKSSIFRFASLLIFVALAAMKYARAESPAFQGQTGVNAQVSSPSVQRSSPGGLAQAKPVSLPHLYWHFLIYVDLLDSAGNKLTAQGKDGSKLSNDLQRKLRFTDAEFAPVRVSSRHLSAELTDLDAQAKDLTSKDGASPNREQLRALNAKRESYISSEIAILRSALQPKKAVELETFMTQFFAPKSVIFQTPSSGQPQNGKAASN